VSDKTGGRSCGQHRRVSGWWGRRDLGSSRAPQVKENRALDFLTGYIVWGSWQLERKCRLKILNHINDVEGYV
jgi:hypothetical protein